MTTYFRVWFSRLEKKRVPWITTYLFDSGARASEVANLEIHFFDPHKKTLIIKARRETVVHRTQVKTTQLIELWRKNTGPFQSRYAVIACL
ncbi:MAG: hypothetical protein SRB2_01762 [Desulfobacteraceae bacterium Eth-SRB2]|nr:MAG: hypothetical protein SRB2_01762 [Desulfobacteraceae bacterium Eth-SRB2]